jgi:acyl-CoA synthetase (AMP-forming)/AMP-acid ligase II
MNIVDLVLYQCRQRPPAPALCAPGSELNVVSYARLERLIHNISRRGHALGLARGNVAAILIRDPILHVAFILGLTRIGVVTVSVRSPQLPKELRVAALVSDAPVGFSNASRVIPADADWTTDDGIALDDSQTGSGRDDDLERIVLTSGTTGDAKAVGFSQRSVLARIFHCYWALGAAMSECSRVFVDPVLATSFGYFAALYVLSRGGMVMFRGTEPIETMQAFGLYKVQGVIAAPAAVAEFADYYNKAPPFVSGLEAIYMGGSLLSRALSDRIRAELCSNLNYGYGSTEASYVAVAPAKITTAIPGAVGFVVPAHTVEAATDAGRALPAGASGQGSHHRPAAPGRLRNRQINRRDLRRPGRLQLASPAVCVWHRRRLELGRCLRYGQFCGVSILYLFVKTVVAGDGSRSHRYRDVIHDDLCDGRLRRRQSQQFRAPTF